MDTSEANALFKTADELYRKEKCREALDVLHSLEIEFPGNHRVLNAKARCLAKLERHEECLSVCDQLLDMGYDKIQPLRDRIKQQIHVDKFIESNPAVESAATYDEDDFAAEELAARPEKKSRFKIKPVRLILLLLIIAGVLHGTVPQWLGATLIAGYFILFYGIQFIFNKLLYKLFTMPFAMKAKALEGATVEVHGVTPGTAPHVEEAEDDNEEDAARKHGPLRYVWIDATITPPLRSSGFTHWEPGELAVAPTSRKIRTMDDHDHCFAVHNIRIMDNGQEVEDEGMKYQGPLRFKTLVGIPESERELQFVYYNQAFGRIPV